MLIITTIANEQSCATLLLIISIIMTTTTPKMIICNKPIIMITSLTVLKSFLFHALFSPTWRNQYIFLLAQLANLIEINNAMMLGANIFMI